MKPKMWVDPQIEAVTERGRRLIAELTADLRKRKVEAEDELDADLANEQCTWLIGPCVAATYLAA